MDEKNVLKIVMYPWFAMGHLTPYLRISNKLAERGHKIFFILPKKTLPKLSHFNLHPHLIEFRPITVPHVDGLPDRIETTADAPLPMHPLLRHAMDLTQPVIESLLQELNPHFVFFDLTPWLQDVARRLGIKSVHYCIISPVAVAYILRDESVPEAYLEPPAGFPPSAIRTYTCEARTLHMCNNGKEHQSDMKIVERFIMVNNECDVIGYRSCREVDGPYLEYLEKKFKKPVLLAGPVLPETPISRTLDENWRKWLDQFKCWQKER